MKRHLWVFLLAVAAVVACSQAPEPKQNEPLGNTTEAFTGSYTATATWPNTGCTVCGATTYACLSLGTLTPLTFTDQTPAGGIATNVTVVLNGVYTATSVDPTINGVAIGPAANPGQDGLSCNACLSPSWSLTNGAGIPSWVYQGTNSIAVVVGNNDACIHDAVITVSYAYHETSSTAVTSSVNPSVLGQSVTFTATVTPQSNGPATGTVTFSDGGTTIGTATLNGADQAFLASSTLAVGSHTIVATYNGDSNFQSSSGSLTQVVHQASTSTSLTSSVNPSTVGQNVTLTATVAVVAPGAGTATGTVTFRDGATTLGTGAVNGSGVATLATSTLAIGSHALTAVYAGSTDFAASTSAVVTQTVDQDGTMVALSSSLNPSTYGTSVTFTATVTTDSTGGTPTGTVTFADGGTPLGTSAVNGSGVATLAISTLTGGTHSISAAYSGDTDHTAASGSLTQVVDARSSATTLASAANPSVFGQSVQLTATVAGAGASPTGTVTFLDGATSIGTGTLNGAGQATLTTSTLPVGTHTLTASYAGDSNYGGSTSAPLSQVVGQAATSTSLASSSNPSIVGSPVVFTASVAVVAPGAGTPTGGVSFFDGATSIGTGTLSGSGVATLSTSTLAVGTHVIKATYGASASFLGSTSVTLSQVVQVDGVTVALASSSNPSTYGLSVTFTATVTTSSTGGTPTGMVTFSDSGTSIGTGTLTAGVATLATATLSGGTHSITAIYGGDSEHAGGSSGALAQVVRVGTTATELASSLNPSVFGQSITLTAHVTAPAPGALLPTGTVTFSDGATTLGSATVDSTGVATFLTSALAVGSHMLHAAYGGDGNYGTSASTALTQVVHVASTSTVVTSSSNPSLSGASVTFSATVTPTPPGSGAPTGMVTFSDGATTLGSGTLNAMGVATFATSTLALGSHTITATYAGDGSFAASTSAALTQNVVSDAATVVLTAAPSPSTYGTSVTLTATVTGSASTPTGSVAFGEGTAMLGTGTVDSSGAATFTTATLPAGTLTMTAAYSGDTTYAAGNATVMLLVAKAATTTKVVSSMNPVNVGQLVTFTATVTSAATGFTGGVEFKDGTTALGTVALHSGTASFATSGLAAGGHTISAAYAGDMNFLASTSIGVTESVLGSTPDGGAPDDAGIAEDGGNDAGSAADASSPSGSGGGCGCRVGSSVPASGATSLAGLGLGIALLVRRRRALRR